MQVDELTVEVRDANLNRVAQFLPTELAGFLAILRFNNPGSWSMKLPANHRLADVIRTPGAGIIVTAGMGVVLSGPVTAAKLEQSVDNLIGDWLIEGSDDSLLLSERLAYPTPSTADVTAQVIPNDIRTGPAETVLKEYVSANMGPDAPVEREIGNLSIETDLARGETVTGNARFTNLQELLFGLAQVGQVGYTIEQEDTDLVFKVYEPVDRSAYIRMDLDNGQLTQTEYGYLNPKVTRAIVGAQGVAEQRVFFEGTNADSLLAETVWGRRIEKFIDSRGSGLTSEIEQSANEALVDEGKTIINLSVSPSDDQTMRWGYDWNLGDKVTVVANDIEASAVVTEVGFSVEPDGVRIGATVGTPVAVNFESRLVSAQTQQEERISNLERSTTGFGISTPYDIVGGSAGTQPTFSGPAVAGTYTRFGNMVHFSVFVDFTNITSFGTGQYYVTLPFHAKNSYMFRDGCLHDVSSGTEFHISGHTTAGDNVVWLNSSDKVSSGVQDVDFTYNYPVTLTTADRFHIAGTYEIEI